MTDDQLTVTLAECVMGWRATANRFLKGDRRWAPRWRFQPTRRIADALQLLKKVAPEAFAVKSEANGVNHARTRIAGSTGTASDKSQARAITYSIARALGIDPAGRGASNGV
jgi:hypothetical protein